uniref:Uncharacterized protein n=1 Tax=Arundo donax TaxID=35708 RepID=A0A0A9B0G8_ARUDO
MMMVVRGHAVIENLRLIAIIGGPKVVHAIFSSKMIWFMMKVGLLKSLVLDVGTVPVKRKMMWGLIGRGWASLSFKKF